MIILNDVICRNYLLCFYVLLIRAVEMEYQNNVTGIFLFFNLNLTFCEKREFYNETKINNLSLSLGFCTPVLNRALALQLPYCTWATPVKVMPKFGKSVASRD